jgi:hypothetical protein
MNVRKHFGDGWTICRNSCFEPFSRQDAKQVQQNGVVPSPGIQQGIEYFICVRHGIPQLDIQTTDFSDDRIGETIEHRHYFWKSARIEFGCIEELER